MHRSAALRKRRPRSSREPVPSWAGLALDPLVDLGVRGYCYFVVVIVMNRGPVDAVVFEDVYEALH